MGAAVVRLVRKRYINMCALWGILPKLEHLGKVCWESINLSDWVRRPWLNGSGEVTGLICFDNLFYYLFKKIHNIRSATRLLSPIIGLVETNQTYVKCKSGLRVWPSIRWRVVWVLLGSSKHAQTVHYYEYVKCIGINSNVCYL